MKTDKKSPYFGIFSISTPVLALFIAFFINSATWGDGYKPSWANFLAFLGGILIASIPCFICSIVAIIRKEKMIGFAFTGLSINGLIVLFYIYNIIA
jgi:hypothetical protein